MLLGACLLKKKEEEIRYRDREQLSGSAIYRDSDLSRFPHLVSNVFFSLLSFWFFYSFTMIVKNYKRKKYLKRVTQKDRQRVVVKNRRRRVRSKLFLASLIALCLVLLYPHFLYITPLISPFCIIPFELWIVVVVDRFITSHKGLSFHTVFCLLLSMLFS